MTIEPGIHHLIIYQGATFRQNFLWQDENENPIDLTGYTARFMARPNVNETTPFITLTTENGGITLGGTDGTIALYMSDTDTAAITAPIGVYDLELAVTAGEVTRLLQGNITISKEVTR